jgi:hypothetical protein
VVWGMLDFVALFFFGYISNVVVEGVCVRHCMGPRVYKVGTAC